MYTHISRLNDLLFLNVFSVSCILHYGFQFSCFCRIISGIFFLHLVYRWKVFKSFFFLLSGFSDILTTVFVTCSPNYSAVCRYYTVLIFSSFLGVYMPWIVVFLVMQHFFLLGSPPPISCKIIFINPILLDPEINVCMRV